MTITSLRRPLFGSYLTFSNFKLTECHPNTNIATLQNRRLTSHVPVFLTSPGPSALYSSSYPRISSIQLRTGQTVSLDEGITTSIPLRNHVSPLKDSTVRQNVLPPSLLLLLTITNSNCPVTFQAVDVPNPYFNPTPPSFSSLQSLQKNPLAQNQKDYSIPNTSPSSIAPLRQSSCVLCSTTKHLTNFSRTISFVPSRHLSYVSCTLHQPNPSIPVSFILCSLTDHPTRTSLTRSVIPSRRFSFDGLYVSLSQSAPVQTMQSFLLDLHAWSGLPWWAAVAVATFSIRTLVVLPLAIHQLQVVARLGKINAEMAKIAPELNREVAVARRMYGWDELHAKRVFKKQLRTIYQRSVLRENCHPFKAVLLVFFQMPLWICLSVSLRNLTAMAHTDFPLALQLKNEGLLWFPDLTVPDPVLIPLLLLLVNLSLTEVHALRQVGKGSLLQKVLLNGSRVAIFVVAAAATINPTCVSFYWLCSSSFGLCQSLLFVSPRVRRALGIPRSSNESATPFRDIARNFRKRFRSTSKPSAD